MINIIPNDFPMFLNHSNIYVYIYMHIYTTPTGCVSLLIWQINPTNPSSRGECFPAIPSFFGGCTFGSTETDCSAFPCWGSISQQAALWDGFGVESLIVETWRVAMFRCLWWVLTQSLNGHFCAQVSCFPVSRAFRMRCIKRISRVRDLQT